MSLKLGFAKKIGQQKITKLAGKPIYLEDKSLYVFPCVHPSYALRRRDAMKEFQAQIKYLAIALPNWLQRP